MKNVFIALENVRSLYNVGSVIRTCSFFGLYNLILLGYSGKITLPNGKPVLNEKLRKTSLLSDTSLNIIMLNNSEELIDYARENKLHIVSIEQSDNAKKLTLENLMDNSVYVLGNELDGVSKLVLTNSDRVLEIHRQGIHNSLNVSVAAGILANLLSTK